MSRSPGDIDNELEIRRAISRYAYTVDRRQFDEFAQLYTPDAVLTVMGQTFTGRDAIRGWLVEMAKSPAGVHMTGNTLVELTGDSASATSDFMYGRKSADGWKLFAVGNYVDRLEKRAGRWLVTRRDITLL